MVVLDHPYSCLWHWVGVLVWHAGLLDIGFHYVVAHVASIHCRAIDIALLEYY